MRVIRAIDGFGDFLGDELEEKNVRTTAQPDPGGRPVPQHRSAEGSDGAFDDQRRHVLGEQRGHIALAAQDLSSQYRECLFGLHAHGV